MCDVLGDRHIPGKVWDSLGYIEQRLGNVPTAATHYHRALGVFREFGERPYEADILTRLGDAYGAAGELSRARESLRQALAIFDDLGHPDTGKVRAKLAGTGGDAEHGGRHLSGQDNKTGR